jgi:hypothetical protein
MARLCSTFLTSLLVFAYPLIGAALTRASDNLEPSPSPPTCRIEVKNALVKIETCLLPPQLSIITLTIERLQSATLVVRAIFPDDVPLPAAKERFFQRLWVDSGGPIITRDDQNALKSTLLQNDGLMRDGLNPNVKALLEFMAGFLEAGQKIPSFNHTNTRALLHFDIPGYTMICDSIGQLRHVAYTAFNTVIEADIRVGDLNSNCRGRCGTGCAQVLQYHQNQYTLECLTHDACRDATHTILGDCEDEFWRAAYGYLNAPDCL